MAQTQAKNVSSQDKHGWLQIDLMLLSKVWPCLADITWTIGKMVSIMLEKIWPYKTAGLLSPACSLLPGDKSSWHRLIIKEHFQVFITLQWHPTYGRLNVSLLCCPLPCRRLSNTTYLPVIQVTKQGGLWAMKSSWLHTQVSWNPISALPLVMVVWISHSGYSP